MASPTRWTWVWVNSGSLWWTGRPGMLRFMGSQRVGHNWVTELNWTEPTPVFLDFPCGSAGKESSCNEGDLGLIPGLGRSPGEGKGYPLQYSGMENSMDKVSGMTEWLSLHFTSCTRLILSLVLKLSITGHQGDLRTEHRLDSIERHIFPNVFSRTSLYQTRPRSRTEAPILLSWAFKLHFQR